MGKVNDLGNDKISKLILRLAIPAMLAQFVSVLYGIVDRIFISGIPEIGTLALAGMGICAPVIAVVTSFSFLVGVAGAPFFAMRMGAKKEDAAKKIMSNCFIMLIALSVVITVVFFLIKKPMLMLFGASDKTLPFADVYFTINILGAIFPLVTIGLNSFITAQGFAKQSMITVVIGAILNLVLDPLFIFVFNMGVAGAAIATVISQFVSCLWVVLFLLSKKSLVKLSLKGFDIKECLSIVRLGVSPFIVTVTDGMVLILFNIMLKTYGGEFSDMYISAATIALSFIQIVTMPMGGITLGCQPIISYNYGAGNYKRVKSSYFGINIICIIFTVIMLLFAMLLPQYFVAIFTQDPETAAVAISAIRIQASGIVFLALQYVGVDSVTALGKAGLAIFLSLTRKIIFMTTLIILLPMFFGALAVFWAEPIADVIGSTLTFIFASIAFNSISKKKPSIMAEPRL